jgi:hypothetical protein
MKLSLTAMQIHAIRVGEARIVRFVLALGFVSLCFSCKTGKDTPDVGDDTAVAGLPGRQSGSEPRKKRVSSAEREQQTQAAIEGFSDLTYKCQDLYTVYAEIDGLLASMGDLLKSEDQLELKPGDEVDVEAVAGEDLAQQMVLLAVASDEAYYAAMRVAVPLRDENPVFRQAVRESLAVIVDEGEPGPASSIDIEFCDLDLLETLWKQLGKPDIPGVTN